ncbi:MAG: RdgB/HAM1 family non-canonical purine NTP pyrophosphatase [bacterium]
MTEPLDLVLATRNAGKVRELGRLLGDSFRVERVPAVVELPEETGRTFAENARLKAEVVFAALGGVVAVLADDSGLEVGVLGGRPGVLSARYAGDGARDEDNVSKLLAELRGRTDREARFVCALCLVLPAGERERGEGRGAGSRLIEVGGTVEGTITEGPRGTAGFGYDPIFQPRGGKKTLAEASPVTKDQVSHRGAASRTLIVRLRDEGLVGHGS